MKPLVSVCIPVWNSEQYLDECLESVFAQDFAGFEVVVVDDSSPGSDTSGRTCRQIVKQAHKRHKKSGCLKVSYIEHSENRGLVECRRTLINAAHGAFILMLAASIFSRKQRTAESFRSTTDSFPEASFFPPG